jgi:hypothetical protein
MERLGNVVFVRRGTERALKAGAAVASTRPDPRFPSPRRPFAFSALIRLWSRLTGRPLYLPSAFAFALALEHYFTLELRRARHHVELQSARDLLRHGSFVVTHGDATL